MARPHRLLEFERPVGLKIVRPSSNRGAFLPASGWVSAGWFESRGRAMVSCSKWGSGRRGSPLALLSVGGLGVSGAAFGLSVFLWASGLWPAAAPVIVVAQGGAILFSGVLVILVLWALLRVVTPDGRDAPADV